MKLDKKNILLVEDDTMISQLFEKRLTQDGANVFSALNGKEGLLKLENNKIDFILLDLDMPVMDGHEMLQRLKANPDTKDIPVVVLTNQENMQDIGKATELGVKEYVLKSEITEKELVEKINTYLAK